LGIDACRNGHDVADAELDFHYLGVEKKLGYSNTPVNMVVHLMEIDGCEMVKGVEKCYFEERDRKYMGYFYPWAEQSIIKVHLNGGKWTLEQSAFRFELNRYFKYSHNSPDWKCEEYERSRNSLPSCFDSFVR
jgi:hypothetical protein